MRGKLWSLGLVASVLVLFGLSQANAESLPEFSWKIPFDIGQRFKPPDNAPPRVTSQEQIYDFMWESFVAGVWPQKKGGMRGEPDRTGNLAAWNTGKESEGPVVWQTWRAPSSVFVRPKEWPIEWNDSVPPLCPFTEDRVIGLSTNYSDNSDALNQPFIQANYPTGPVTDQNGNYLRYQVVLNQSYFSYVSFFRYYNPKRQTKAVQRYIKFVEQNGMQPPESNSRNARTFQGLPNGTEAYLEDFFHLPDYAHTGIMELKVTWKILSGDDKLARFYWRDVMFYNPDGSCTTAKAGLIAAHIHRVTQFGHVGTTFEQVDNTNLQPEYSSQFVQDAAPLPPHASLNPGSADDPAEYDNGYEVCDFLGERCETGLRGLILTPIKDGESLSPVPPITNVARQVSIPEDVQKINAKWRKSLEGTVWFYYQMIGTQNRNLNVKPNPNLGPGIDGVGSAQASNTNNLINTALESYTQKGYSCAGCHQNAFPLGVEFPFPTFEENFAPLHTISFLLQNAITNKGR